MISDPWHYPRTLLAAQVLSLFESGLSSALVFFAPRRMGKTEFLLKDIKPQAENNGWQVLYFSFLDSNENADLEFSKALAQFIDSKKLFSSNLKALRTIKKFSAAAAGIEASVELNDIKAKQKSLKELLGYLAEKGKILLLMDEVQALSQHSQNTHFVATLRTQLDMHKDKIKVIFTGSSQHGLRLMFSHAKAPFFHFGQNLPFPELDEGFTEHLAAMFYRVTKRKIDSKKLWIAFEKIQKIPQLARVLVERLALNPTLSLEETQQQLIAEIYDARSFAEKWSQCSVLEQLLLVEIANGTVSFFSALTRKKLAKNLGIEELLVPAIQSTLRTLERKNFIGKHAERNSYFIDDLNFKNWLLQQS